MRLTIFLSILTVIMCSCSRDYRWRISEGSKQISLGDHDEALIQFERAYKMNPYRAEAQVGLAKLSQSKGDTWNAISLYSEALLKYKTLEHHCPILRAKNILLDSLALDLIKSPYKYKKRKQYLLADLHLKEMKRSHLFYSCGEYNEIESSSSSMVSLYASKTAELDGDLVLARNLLFDVDLTELKSSQYSEYTIFTTQLLLDLNSEDVLLFIESHRPLGRSNTTMKKLLGNIYSSLLLSLSQNGQMLQVRYLLESNHLTPFLSEAQLVKYQSLVIESLLNNLEQESFEIQYVDDLNSYIIRSGHLKYLTRLDIEVLSFLIRQKDYTRLYRHAILAEGRGVSEELLNESFGIALNGLATEKFYRGDYDATTNFLNELLSRLPNNKDAFSLRAKVRLKLGKAYIHIGDKHLDEDRFELAFESYGLALKVDELSRKAATFGMYRALRLSYQASKAYDLLKEYRQFYLSDRETADVEYQLAELSALLGTNYVWNHLEFLRTSEYYDNARLMAKNDNEYYNLREDIRFLKWLKGVQRASFRIKNIFDIVGRDVGPRSSDVMIIIRYDDKAFISSRYDNVESIFGENLSIIADIPRYIQLEIYDHDNTGTIMDWYEGSERLYSGSYDSYLDIWSTLHQPSYCKFTPSFKLSSQNAQIFGFTSIAKDFQVDYSNVYLGTKGIFQIALETAYKLLKRSLPLPAFAFVESLEYMFTADRSLEPLTLSAGLRKYLANIYPKSSFLIYLKNIDLVRILVDGANEVYASFLISSSVSYE